MKFHMAKKKFEKMTFPSKLHFKYTAQTRKAVFTLKMFTQNNSKSKMTTQIHYKKPLMKINNIHGMNTCMLLYKRHYIISSKPDRESKFVNA
jgi:hypothetical protein